MDHSTMHNEAQQLLSQAAPAPSVMHCNCSRFRSMQLYAITWTYCELQLVSYSMSLPSGCTHLSRMMLTVRRPFTLASWITSCTRAGRQAGRSAGRLMDRQTEY